MKATLDTSAIIYLNDFSMFEELFTAHEVIEEVKDKISSMKVSSLNLKIIDPSNETLEEIRNVAKNTGDLEKMSQTDLKVLALAKETDTVIISDDRNVQNVAEKIGISYISIFNKKITKLLIWKNFCKNCHKYFEGKNTCDICGNKLVRVPVEERDISGI